MKPATTPLKTKEDAFSIADRMAVSMTAINLIKASETSRLNKVKEFFKPKLGAHTKERDSHKKRLSAWVMKNAELLFNGAKTGTVKSAMMEISLSKNPPAITKVNPDATDDELINLALSLGFDSVIKTERSISLDALSALTDEELNNLGFCRTQTTTCAFKLIVDKSQSERSKTQAATDSEAA